VNHDGASRQARRAATRIGKKPDAQEEYEFG
jgi:hypothetical protein